jgi:hypothetical protein
MMVAMSDLFSLIWHAAIGLFRSRAALQAEILIMRHQLNVLRRKVAQAGGSGQYRSRSADRPLSPDTTVLDTLKIINPETLIRWLSSLLALEIATARWSAQDAGGYPPADSGNEYRKSALGRTADPRSATAAQSPWQNGYCERAISSIRGDCLDHVIVFGEQHLRHLLRCYVNYYNRSRTHLSLNKDAPVRRPVHAVGCIEARPVLGGLHHCYVRI